MFDRQPDVLREWANSEDGRKLYEQLARDLQAFQCVEQLALIMAFLMIYRRLLPDISDCSDQPIKGSYLADLDALFHGEPLGNSGRVAEQMVFALLRVLHSFGDQSEDLILFLNTVLDREPPLLHALDGCSDVYAFLRTEGYLHKTAIAKVSHIKMSELGRDDDTDWVKIQQPVEWPLQDHSPGPCSGCTPPASETEYVPAVLNLRTCFTDLYRSSKEQGGNPLKIDITHTIEASTMTGTTEEDTRVSSIAPPSGFRKDQYTLIRLSEVEDRNILEMLDTQIGTMNQVLHIEELSDGSWEICILKSHSHAVQDALGKIFPDSDVDLKYNPFEPTANDLKIWDYDMAKKLRRLWFLPRAVRIVEKCWSAAAAAYYAYILEVKYEMAK